MAKTNSGPVLGIDLGGTNMQFGVVDANGKVIGRAKKKTKAEEGLEKVIDRLVDGANDAAKEAKLTLEELQAVGIAAAGAIDTPNGVILESPNLGWRDVPFRDLLKKRLGRPVVLENDVNGAVWGEYLLGGGKGRGDCFGVWVGTGVGGGLVLNGRIYRGDFFTAGEVGHTVIDPHEPRGLGKLEERCSRTGMSRLILARLHAYPKSMLHEMIDRATGITGSKMLAKAYDAKDPLTVDVVHEAADLLGQAIANWVTVLALDTVIIGGGVTEALGKPYLDRIRASFEAWVFPDRCKKCKLLATTLLDDAGLLGAAMLAREAE